MNRFLRLAQNNGHRKGFTLSEMLITMAVVAIFLAVVIPMATLQKNAAAKDKDAYLCVAKDSASLSAGSCLAVINKCQYNQGNACSALEQLASVSAYSSNALKIIDNICSSGGKRACEILTNRCIDDPTKCSLADSTNTTYDEATETDYSIHKYLDMAADSTNYGKVTLYSILKERVRQGIENIVNRVTTDCKGNSSSMACTLLSKKLYDFNDGEESQFTIENSGIDFVSTAHTGGTGIANLATRASGPILERDTDYGIETGWTLQNTAEVATLVPTTYTNATDGSYTIADAFAGITRADPPPFGYGSELFNSWAYTYNDGTTNTTRYGEIETDGTNLYHLYYGYGIAKLDMSGNLVAAIRYGAGASYPGKVYLLKGFKLDGNYIYAIASHYNADGKFCILKLNKSDLSMVSGYPRVYSESTIRDTSMYMSGMVIASDKIYFAGRLITPSPITIYYGCIDKATGALEWVKEIAAANIDTYRAGVDLKMGDDGFLYLSFNNNRNNNFETIQIIKINPATATSVNDYANSGIVWSKTLENTAFWNVSSWSALYGHYSLEFRSTPVSVVKDGKIYIAAASQTYESDAYSNIGIDKVAFFKIDTALADADNSNCVDWTKAYSLTYSSNPGARPRIAYESLAYSSDAFYISGNFYPYASPYYINNFIMSFDYSGNLNWQKTFGTIPYESRLQPLLYYDNALYGKLVAETATSGYTPPVLFKIIPGSVSGSVDPVYRYMTTSSTNHIADIANKIIAVDITEPTQVSGTGIRYLVSFDGRTTWKRWDGSKWQTVDTSAGLSNSAVYPNGNTAAEVKTGLTNKIVNSSTNGINDDNLDFAVIMTTANSNTPFLYSINAWYY